MATHLRNLQRAALKVSLVWIGVWSSTAWPLAKVLFIVIDGVRDLEIQGRAKDDFGKPVAGASLFPQLTQLRKEGLFFPNMTTSNRFGVSLPGYADLFTGKRQESIQTNGASPQDIKSMSATIFEETQRQLQLAETDVMVLGSWEKICNIASPTSAGKKTFFQSCGWEKGKHIKPAVYEDSRNDSDTFLQASQLIAEKHPRFTFIHFGDADEEAHLQKNVKKKLKMSYGIHHYHQALRDSDYYIGRLWKQIQADSFYKGETYLFVTTDHGRDDDSDSFSDHGSCLFCSGHTRIFGLIAGPGLKSRTITTRYQHIDLAPTVASLLGVDLKSATGHLIPEVFPTRSLATPQN